MVLKSMVKPLVKMLMKALSTVPKSMAKSLTENGEGIVDEVEVDGEAKAAFFLGS